MSGQDLITNDVWYVKSQGAVRGPFSESVLLSMKESGRIALDTLISADREHWKPISVLGGTFSQSEIALTDGQFPLATEMASPGVQFYIHLDGQTVGPFSVQTIQERISAGLLGPTDPVWMQGNPAWLPAARLPGLAFPVRTVPISAWLKQNALLLTVVVVAVLALMIAPTWYVLAVNASRVAKLNEEKADELHRQELESAQNISKLDREQAARQKREDDLREYQKMKLDYEIQIERIRANRDQNIARGQDADAETRALTETNKQLEEINATIKRLEEEK
ncbi:MAG TPA: GYF domain-containing protein [Pirellulales bacterium]|nr:GYF domain-containing protein [Pirellulales bacterium]